MASLTPLSYETKSLLRIRTYGTGSPLVLLHGWGLNSGVWQSVIERFSQRYQVITIDLPGYGENVACVPEAYTLAAVCEWVADKIPANAILLGWSMGGLIAQQIAIQNSPSLRALITLSSSPCFQQKKDWLGIKPNVLGTFEQQLAQDYVKTLNRFMAIQALGSPEAKSEIVLLKQAISAYPMPDLLALKGGLNLLSGVDLRADLKHIKVPTLRLYGRLDSLVPADNAETIQQLQPDSSHFIFDHAAHAPFISHPNQWFAVVEPFVERYS